MADDEERAAIWFEGPAGRLEARGQGPGDGSPVILLHPHPKGEGTMGSRLVYDLAQGLADAGYHTYRFNFRGVGRSAGKYADGDGETDDAVAVYDEVVQRRGEVPVVIGHSFGGGVATRLATRRDIETLVLIGTPPRVSTSHLDAVHDAAHAIGHVHVIVGTEDEYVAVEDARRLADAFPEKAKLHVLDGAGHFLEPSHNDRVLALVEKILNESR